MCVSQSAVSCFTQGMSPTPASHTGLVLQKGKAAKIWRKRLFYILEIFFRLVLT